MEEIDEVYPDESIQEEQKDVHVDYTGPLSVFGSSGQNKISNKSNESFERLKKECSTHHVDLDMKQLSLNEIMMVASSSHGSNTSHGNSFERREAATTGSSNHPMQ